MVVIKAHFNGKTIVVPQELRGAPPGEVLLVLENLSPKTDDRQDWVNAQESAFAKVWDNVEDEVYDSL